MFATADATPDDAGHGDDPSAESAEHPAPRCSAKACRAAATVDLTWRNPRLHDAARRKHWLACGEHADQLAGFLERRGFLLSRGPLTTDHG